MKICSINQDSHLTSISWNCRGIKKKYMTIQQEIIAPLTPHVICLQEPITSTGFSGYTTYSKPHQKNLRTLTMIRDDLQHQQIAVNNNFIINTFIAQKHTYILINIYLNSGSEASRRVICDSISDIVIRIQNWDQCIILVAGDLNIQPCTPTLINTIPNSEAIADMLDTLNIRCSAQWAKVITRKQKSTTTARDGTKQTTLHESTLDYWFWQNRGTLQKINNQYLSDHFPIMLTTPLDDNYEYEEILPPAAFKFAKFYKNRAEIKEEYKEKK
jgi:exonuclease III